MSEYSHIKCFGLNRYTLDKNAIKIFGVLVSIEPFWLSLSSLVSIFISISVPDNSSSGFSLDITARNYIYVKID